MNTDIDSDFEVGFILASPTERFIAALIDGLIITMVSLTGIGAIIGILYFLLKDSLPIFNGQGFGKRIMKIKVLDDETNQPLKNNYVKGIIRNISLLVPILQFIDAFMVFSTNGKRFGDQWAKTIVVQDI